MANTSFPYFLSSASADRPDWGRNWPWFMVLGVALIVAGGFAIGYPAVATVTSVTVFAYLLLIGAAIEIASAIWAGKWDGFFLHLLSGLLSLFVGVVLIERPGEGAAAFTMILAVFFVAGGLIRAVYALTHHFHGWGWALLNGVITFILGVMIWRQWPVSSFWVIGTFVGIDLIFNGVSWIMLGMAMKSMRSAVNQSFAG